MKFNYIFFVMNKPTFLLVILGAALLHTTSFAADCERDINACAGNKLNQMLAMNRIESVLSEHLYDIQSETSKIQFRVDSPIGEIWGSFDNFEGGFAILESGIHNQPADVHVKTDSLNSESGFIGLLLKSESFFDVENFPRIRFVGSSFEWFNDSQAVLKGHMTIQNTTKPVAFYVNMVKTNTENKYAERITMQASTTIKRSEFGIYTLLPIVSDNVNLYMNVDAIKKKTSTI